MSIQVQADAKSVHASLHMETKAAAEESQESCDQVHKGEASYLEEKCCLEVMSLCKKYRRECFVNVTRGWFPKTFPNQAGPFGLGGGVGSGRLEPVTQTTTAEPVETTSTTKKSPPSRVSGNSGKGGKGARLTSSTRKGGKGGRKRSLLAEISSRAEEATSDVQHRRQGRRQEVLDQSLGDKCVER